MMHFADLHIHTTASDGVFPPEAIVALAKNASLKTIAVTDHDTVGSLHAARQCAKKAGMTFIPGVEISAGHEHEIHILGYGVSPDNAALLHFFEEQKQSRCHRASKMIKKLYSLGYTIDEESVFSQADDTVGRPHIARALLERGYVSSVPEAFEKLLGSGKPGYVSPDVIPPTKVISLLRASGAVPVLAHPALLKWPGTKLLPLLREWMNHGLMGLEVYHPSQKDAFDHWRSIAQTHHLLITGGSDFHAPNTMDGPLGGMAPAWFSADDDVPQLLEAISHTGDL